MAAPKWDFTPERQALARKLFDDGLSRNAAARQIGCTGPTLTKYCATLDPPIDWDRTGASQVAVANKALAARLQRSEFAEQALASARRRVAELDQPYETAALGMAAGGAGSQWYSRTSTKPAAQETANLTRAAESLSRIALRMVEFDRAMGGDPEVTKASLLDLSVTLRANRVPVEPEGDTE